MSPSLGSLIPALTWIQVGLDNMGRFKVPGSDKAINWLTKAINGRKEMIHYLCNSITLILVICFWCIEPFYRPIENQADHPSIMNFFGLSLFLQFYWHCRFAANASVSVTPHMIKYTKQVVIYRGTKDPPFRNNKSWLICYIINVGCGKPELIHQWWGGKYLCNIASFKPR